MMGPSLAIGGSGGGTPGAPGKSAYQIAVDNGFTGTEIEWLTSLEGQPGDPGDPGEDGKSVELQKSATAIQWRQEGGVFADLVPLEDLKGDPGESAVQYDNNAVDLGPVRMAWGSADSILGTPEAFLFPSEFAAPPVVQITRHSQGTILVPQNVTKTGFTIYRGELLANPIPFQWQAVGLKPDPGVVAPNSFDVSGMPTWSSAIRAQRAGKRNARIMCIGDSTTMGYGSNGATTVNNDRANSYPTQLAAIMTARGSKASWQNFIGNGNAPTPSAYDNRLTLGASWGNSLVMTSGGFTHRTSGTSPTPLTFTPTESWDTAEIYIFKGESITTNGVTVAIDGVTKGTINSFWDNSSPGMANANYFSTNTAGMHVLGLTGFHPSGAVHVLGGITYNSAVKEISVLNAGWGGTKAAEVGSGTNANFTLQIIKEYNPDLVILNLGINDAASTSPVLTTSLFQTQMQAIIDAARASGADVLLVVPNDCDPATWGTRLQTLSSGIIDLATRTSLRVVDLRNTLGTYAQAVSAGYMRDVAHPNGTGYGKIATAIADMIMPAGA